MVRIVTWCYDCWLRIIIISYLKPYNSEQTNDYYWIETIIWNYIIEHKLVYDWNIWNHTAVCKKY